MPRPDSMWGEPARPETFDAVLGQVATAASVVLRGVAGVGKTTLAGQIAQRRRAEGMPVVWLTGSSADSTVPFGGVARLLPPGPSIDAEAMDELSQQLQIAGGDGTALVIVDDVPLLDERSAELFADLAAKRQARLLVTARTGARLPVALDRLVVRGELQHIDVTPLSADQLQTMVSRRLKGPLSSAALETTTLLSAGLPLYARELIESALEMGTLQLTADGWAYVEAPVAPSSLVDLVGARYMRLPADQRAAFEAIAVAEPLPLHAASLLAEPGVLGELESAGLVQLVAAPLGASIRLAHPLYSDAVRQHLGPLAVRGAAARAADALTDGTAIGEIGSGETWRAACLRLDHGLPVSPSDAVDAARRALGLKDPELALRFVALAGDDVEGLLVRGSVHASQGDAVAAEAALRTAIVRSSDDGIRARAVSRLAHSLVTAGGRFRDAIEVLERELRQISDPRWDEFLRADLAYARSWAGEAVAIPHELADDPATRANECLIGAVVSVMQGELDQTHRFVTEGLPLVPAIVADVPAARDLLMLSRFLALAFAGSSEASRQLVTAEFERATSYSDAAAGTWLAVRAVQRLLDGDAGGALEDTGRALPRLATVDIGGLRPLTLAVRSLAAARQGDVELAESAQRQIPERWRSEPKVHVFSAAAAAWCTVTRGDERSAAAQFTAAGRRAVEDHHTVFGAVIAYDAVRIGRPRSALPVLRDAAASCSGGLVSALLEHAEALDADRPDRLLEVATALPALGFTVGGAEAAAQAAERFAVRGEADLATRCRYLASSTLSRIPGAPSRAARASRGLTRREAEIAALGASGLPSRKIGELLGISARTVDNHLAAVYRKLGVTNRSALGLALSPNVAHP